jgi:hypothetical protein
MFYRKLVYLLFFFGVLFGCVASQNIPEKTIASSIKTIEIIPIEPPPLSGMPMNTDAYNPNIMISLSMIPDTSFQSVARSATLLFSGWMLIEAATAGLDTDKDVRLLDMMSLEGKWSPTVILAEEAGSQIASGSSIRINTIKFYYELPVDNREVTWHMEDWLGPIRRWYGEEQSLYDYSKIISKEVDIVLEVGICNYELAFDGLLVQVMLKMIDPATGKTLGRVRNYEYQKVPPINELLANDGNEFKLIFNRIGQELINKSLIEIGLLPE